MFGSPRSRANLRPPATSADRTTEVQTKGPWRASCAGPSVARRPLGGVRCARDALRPAQAQVGGGHPHGGRRLCATHEAVALAAIRGATEGQRTTPVHRVGGDVAARVEVSCCFEVGKRQRRTEDRRRANRRKVQSNIGPVLRGAGAKDAASRSLELAHTCAFQSCAHKRRALADGHLRGSVKLASWRATISCVCGQDVVFERTTAPKQRGVAPKPYLAVCEQHDVW